MSFVLLFLNRCSTDFDLNSEWKEIAIVYGLLDQTAEFQYIRLSKAFLTKGNANEIAQIADSVYFQNATVQLKAYSVGADGAIWNGDRYELPSNASLKQTIDLEKVNASESSVHPDKDTDGIFVSNPNILYFTDAALNEDYVYELVVTTDDGNIVTAVTPIVKDFVTLYPKELLDFNMVGERRALKWAPAPNGEIYDIACEFRYREEVNNDPSNFFLDTVSYSVFTSRLADQIFMNGNLFEYDFVNASFLQHIANRIGTENASEVNRKHTNPIRFKFFAGSKDLERFVRVSQTENSGILSGQAKPIYTNVVNGLGLFASRYEKVVDIDLSVQSVKRLICDPITADLEFFDPLVSESDCN